jgi:hypothetical protein
MPRWPALARWARRPNPLFADMALALVLAVFSLLTLETQQQQQGDRSSDTELSVQPIPITPGDPVEITVRKGGKPFRVPNVEPLLTIQNVTTGEWKTYVAKPTPKPGVYRIPAVHPGAGTYSYSVLYGPFEQNVRVRGPSDPPPSELDSPPAESGSPSLWAVALIHAVLAMPVLTLIFRNYYKDIPTEIMSAAMMDSGSFWRIFFEIIVPMSGNILIVILILQITSVWNDYLIGVTFGGFNAQPMTVKAILVPSGDQAMVPSTISVPATRFSPEPSGRTT